MQESFSNSDEEVGEDRKMADQLVRLALRRYRFGRTEANEAFAVENNGPNVAKLLRGSDSLRASLGRAYYKTYKRTPNASAVADALNVLCGEALEVEAEELSLRVAKHQDGIVLDLASSDGKAVVIGANGWTIVDRSPVLFRRTALTARLPVPVPGGKLREVRELLNVSDESWPLLKGWLTSALIPWIAHPVLMLGGIQGTGKSTAMRLMCGLFDPSEAPLRSEPRDVEQWATMAAGSWCVALDNVSHLSPWLSDALCKAVTGDGFVRRRLYSDSDVAVLSFRRVVGMTSIDAGALRGDLADRLLLVELEPIDDVRRRSEAEILHLYDQMRPRLLGALLDTVVGVLAALPDVRLQQMPRMADFTRVLAAMDKSDKSDDPALPIYLGQHVRLAAEVIEADPVAGAIVALVQQQGEWCGTATELLAAIRPEHPSKGWPNTPQAMGGRLKRLIPALKLFGIEVEVGRGTDRARTRSYVLKNATQKVVQVVRTAEDVADNADNSDRNFPPFSADEAPFDDGDWREIE